ncbi:MAG: MarC family protein [Paracoccaceae bacterium]|nr:Multiple antibiotic transporter [Rhodobacterales bacterium HTCC2150] [Rhodobacteraceae bacterium HTCC2150]MDG1529780.1 MarC family protein [Paracoccaceae bacterium]
MIETAALITVFATLFVVIDPIGLVPMFVALTRGMDASERRSIAARACLVAVFVLVLFGLMGEAILGFIGISMGAFRIAGGILLFLTALEMLFERRTQRREGQKGSGADPSVFPLATPLIAGPGAIASLILLTGQNGGDWTWVAAVLGLMILVVTTVFLLFLTAPLFEKALGKTGINVITRLLGMLLAALAIQFIVDGIADLALFAT